MKYGLLTYTTHNIGDDIQSLAAMQFLPRVDAYLDRDRLTDYTAADEIFLIANGWFSHLPENFPPPASIRAWWSSVHLCGPQMCTEQFLRYLRQQGPVGCRDLATLRRLKELGVEAYFSGCLTLTLERPTNLFRTEDVLIVDVPRSKYSQIPRAILNKARHLTHYLGIHPISARDRLQRARGLLAEYARASLVVTGRLHCALPCIAYGTPCIFLADQPRDPRFTGYEFVLGMDVEPNFRHPPKPPAVQKAIASLREGARLAVEQLRLAPDVQVGPLLNCMKSVNLQQE